jgi:hypothetical protein
MHASIARDEPVPYAARRLAEVIVQGCFAAKDPNTIAGWSRVAGRSPSTMRACCRAAGARPKEALDFARVLRAARLRQAHPDWEPGDLLDICDARTLARLLRRGDISNLFEITPVPLEALCRCQHFVTKERVIQEVVGLLNDPAHRTAS